MKFASWPRALLSWLQATRCKWLLVVLLLCLVLQENYPFSHFPMYSSFASHTYLIYLADAEGQPIATPRFGLSSSALKKIFDRYRRVALKKFEGSGKERVSLAEKAAGESLLHYLDGLAERRPPARKLISGMQVRHVRVDQTAGTLTFETLALAQHQ
jgi:hypothetical protein